MAAGESIVRPFPSPFFRAFVQHPLFFPRPMKRQIFFSGNRLKKRLPRAPLKVGNRYLRVLIYWGVAVTLHLGNFQFQTNVPFRVGGNSKCAQGGKSHVHLCPSYVNLENILYI